MTTFRNHDGRIHEKKKYIKVGVLFRTMVTYGSISSKSA